MFFRIFLGAVLFVTTAFAQLPQRTAVDRLRPPTVIVAVSRDGLTLAVARSDDTETKHSGRIELWNTVTGELQRTITGFDGPIWSLTFAADGKTIVTLSTEFHEAKIQSSTKDREEKVYAELKWWSTESGEFVRKVQVGNEGVSSVEGTWSPAGDLLALIERYMDRQLAQVSERGAYQQRIVRPGFVDLEHMELKLLNADTAQRTVKLEDSTRTFRAVYWQVFGRLQHPVFSPDGKLLAAVAAPEVTLWGVESGKKLLTLKKIVGVPAAVAFSADNQMVAIASIKGTMPGGESDLTVWEVTTGKLLYQIKGKNDLIACIQFAAQGQVLLIGSLQYEPEGATGTVKMWDLREGRLARFNVREGEVVSSLTLLPQQAAVVLQSGSEVELRDSRTWKVRYSFDPSDAEKSEAMRGSRFLLSAKRAVAVAFSHDGTTVSAQIPGEGIRRWDARTGGIKEPVANEKLAETIAAVSPSGDLVAELVAEGVRLTDRANGTSKVIPLRLPGPTSPLALSDDGRSVVTADDSGAIQLWDVTAGKLVRTINAGQKVTALALDRTGQLLASAQTDRSILIWDLRTGAQLGELKKHEDVINALVFSPDGQTLASGGDDRTAVLWDVPSRRSKRTLKGHDLTVTSLAFSPDGLTLASGSGNASVVLWNVTNGKLDRVLR